MPVLLSVTGCSKQLWSQRQTLTHSCLHQRQSETFSLRNVEQREKRKRVRPREKKQSETAEKERAEAAPSACSENPRWVFMASRSTSVLLPRLLVRINLMLHILSIYLSNATICWHATNRSGSIREKITANLEFGIDVNKPSSFSITVMVQCCNANWLWTQKYVFSSVSVSRRLRRSSPAVQICKIT